MNLTITTIDESRGNQINETKATKRFFQNCRRFKFTVTSVHDLNFLKIDHYRSEKTTKEKNASNNCAFTQVEKQAEKQAEKRTVAKLTNKHAWTEKLKFDRKSFFK